jgi:hypothetical protein
VQAVASKGPTTSKQFLAFLGALTRETIVDVSAKVMKSSEPIKSTTQHEVELGLLSVFVVSAAQSPLPILLEDAERPKPLIKAQKEEIRRIDAEIAKATEELSAATDETVKAEIQKRLDALSTEKGTAQKFVVLSRNQMLDNRVIDLRVRSSPINQSISHQSTNSFELLIDWIDTDTSQSGHLPIAVGRLHFIP